MAQKTTSYIYHSTEKGLSLNTKNPKDVPLQPVISAEEFNKQGGFDPNTVVSRNTDGSIASYFKDPIWDFSAFHYTNQRNGRLYFSDDEKLNSEVKTILLLTMIAPTTHLVGISVHTIRGFLLNRLANFCISNSSTLTELINTKGGIKLVKVIKDSMPYYAQGVISISEHLYYLRDKIGFKHGFNPLSKTSLSHLRKIVRTYDTERNQNPVIPSRIFETIIHDTIIEYESLLPVLDQLLAMQREIDLHPMIGYSTQRQMVLCRKHCATSFGQLKTFYPTNYDLAAKYPLARDFLNIKFKTTKVKPKKNSCGFHVLYHRCSVLQAINYIQRLCQDIIIMFTGMRPAEANMLPYFGSKETIVDGVKYWLIYGFAAKKSSVNPPFEMWVTNNYGYRAFKTAKLIADYYYQRNQRKPIKNTPEGVFSPELSPLFLREDGKPIMHVRRIGLTKTPLSANLYYITQFDYNELKMIDPHRVWEKSNEFNVGKPFPVKLSLFRRSIAFFASASGVRLVDLKNQLHHLFESQTFYYGQGSGRANPFLRDTHTFASYFNQVKHEAEAFSLINDVINFDGKLFGAGALYAERNNVFNNIRVQPREHTIRSIKLGEISYKDTHLGGCMKTTPCHQKALGSVTACLDCKDAVIKLKKLSYAIKDQAHMVDCLDPERLEYRTEIDELIKMLNFGINNISNAINNLDRRHTEYKQFRTQQKVFERMKNHYLKMIQHTEEAT